jgi:hypothetical protein
MIMHHVQPTFAIQGGHFKRTRLLTQHGPSIRDTPHSILTCLASWGQTGEPAEVPCQTVHPWLWAPGIYTKGFVGGSHDIGTSQTRGANLSAPLGNEAGLSLFTNSRS